MTRRRQCRSNTVGKTRIEGRRVSLPEQILLGNPGFVITYAVRVPELFDTRTTGDAWIQAAFRRMVQTTAILQSIVVVNDQHEEQHEEQHYKQDVQYHHQTQEHWPRLVILPGTNNTSFATDQQAQENMRAYTTQQMEIIRDGEIKERLQPVMRAVFARGKQHSYIGLAAPHHYLDGIAVGVVILKFLFYAKLPRILWPLVDRCSADRTFVPSFMEMAFKSDYQYLDTGNLNVYNENENQQIGTRCKSCSKMGDPRNFKFTNYKVGDTMYGYSKVIGFHTDPKIMEACRAELRRDGITVTTIFDALAVKILAELINNTSAATTTNEGEYDQLDTNFPLLVLTPIDGRKLGKWGDKRDKFKGFPVVAEYSFFTATQIPFHVARTLSLRGIATMIKENVARTLTDASFRMNQLQGISYVHVLCGSSCPQLDRGTLRLMKMAGIKPFEAVPLPKKAFKPMVWLLCGTIYPKTTIAADIHLPIPGLSDDLVRETIARCVEGSSIECLFTMQGINQDIQRPTCGL